MCYVVACCSVTECLAQGSQSGGAPLHCLVRLDKQPDAHTIRVVEERNMLMPVLRN